MSNVLKIRLNDHPRQKIHLAAWNAAVLSSKTAIFDSLPPEMQEAITKVRPTLPALRPDCRCQRCLGKGYRNDKQHWIVVEGETISGRICFRCNGSGIEAHMEPEFFRRRTIDTILQTSPSRIDEWAAKVLETPENPYFCVMEDIAQTWQQTRSLEAIKQLPH